MTGTKKRRPVSRTASLNISHRRSVGWSDALVSHELAKFARFIHFHHNVAAADKLALHVQLGDRRPIGIGLDTLTDSLILQHVDRLVAHA